MTVGVGVSVGGSCVGADVADGVGVGVVVGTGGMVGVVGVGVGVGIGGGVVGAEVGSAVTAERMTVGVSPIAARVGTSPMVIVGVEALGTIQCRASRRRAETTQTAVMVTTSSQYLAEKALRLSLSSTIT